VSALAPDSDAARLATLAGRLREGRLRVLIAGEAKRGKSTVANALVGCEVLPSGVTPLTAIATTLVYGAGHATVALEAGTTERRPLADLPGLVTEPGNPGNRLGILDVTVHLDTPLLAAGIELVDTPNTGSVYEHNTEQARRALKTLDAAVMVLTADRSRGRQQDDRGHGEQEEAAERIYVQEAPQPRSGPPRVSRTSRTTAAVSASAAPAIVTSPAVRARAPAPPATDPASGPRAIRIASAVIRAVL
jgi:Dynamin family